MRSSASNRQQTRRAFFAIGVVWLMAVITNPEKEQRSTSEDAVNEAIRIYDGTEQPDRSPSLSAFFEETVAPEMVARNEAVKLRQYRNSIARFTAFLSNAANTSSIRDIRGITDLHAVQWQQSESAAGIAASTINVHWTRIRAVLRRAAPAEKGNPQGLGLIDRVPYLRPLSTAKPKPKVVSLETIDALYLYGAPDMTWPESWEMVSGAMAWRAWLVCAYNLAMRTRDLLSLRWENIHSDPASLDPESDNENPWGWVEFLPQKTRNTKPETLVLPMNEWVRSHLDSIRSESKFVFGPKMSKVSNDTLYGRRDRPGSGQWTRLIELSSTHVAGGIDRFTIKTLRKTANTQFNRLDRKLGEHILGHAPRGVNDVFYQQWEADVIEFVSKLPQPTSFKKRPSQPLRQELLF